MLKLQLFSADVSPINVTTQQTMSPTMKTFYNTTLLQNAREAMVFSQLGMKQPMHGNKVEWRKFNTFEKALTPLTEGVIPSGKTFGMTKIEATTTQHGDYVAVSDRLELEAFDDVIFGATEEMGATEGETYDTLTRNNLVSGNSVAYCPTISGTTESAVTSRSQLDATAKITPKMINKTVTWLKKNKAPKFSGNTYVMVIHPSQAEDLRESEEWKEFHKYNDVAPIFNGEIGTLHGMRFIESNNVKVFKGANLTASARNLTVKTASTTATTSVAVTEAISADEATALAGRLVLIGNNICEIVEATAGTAGNAAFEIKTGITLTADAKIYPGEGGKEGCAVYGALAMGKDAFGVLDPEGEGMELIVKTKGQIGGPLEQFSTIGYKFCHGTKILYEERIIRIESGSSYSSIDEAN